MNDFLQLVGKSILVLGVANRKSVAWHVAQVLQEAGADVIYSVRNESRRESVQKLVGEAPVLICDIEHEDQIERLKQQVSELRPKLHGMLHSIAFADYAAVKGASARQSSEQTKEISGPMPFHETPKSAFLRAVDISCFSLIALSNSFRDLLDADASVVTVSISTTRMAAENYGFMAPVKAALDSSLAFLAKSFSSFSRVRFNAVAPGLLKTSASAGIPGYVDAYLYAEQATLRKQAVQTAEVANAAAFLLSPRSSGVNAQQLIIDAGMSVNYFDRQLIRGTLDSPGPK
ncbi:MAG TPA: SDR family oxidoreductase [Pirellulales bacterium]